MEESARNRTFFDGCIMTYGAATRHMMEVWEEFTGEPMNKLSGYPKDRFKEALSYFVRAMPNGDGAELRKKLNEATHDDSILKSLIRDNLDSPEAALAPDIDDVPPSVFKKAIWEEALDRVDDEPIDVNLDTFLRGAVTRAIGAMEWKRRFNVGENRHFPRMVQWLREVQEETTTDAGVGFRLMNRSSGGRLPTYPTGPHSLKVRLDARWL